MDLARKSFNSLSGIADSSEYYKSLLENTVECVWVFDFTNYCFQYISPSIYNLRGLTVEEAMQEIPEHSFTPNSLQKIKNSKLKRFPRFMSGDRSEDVVCNISEYEQYCKDGSIKIMAISTRLVFNEETQGINIVGVSRDITKRKQYEKELIEKLRQKINIIEKFNPYTLEDTSNLRIYSFKRFIVYGANQKDAINWRTSKTEELFAFFMHKNNTKISKFEIIENLWSDISLKKSTTYLHTTLYYMKKDLLSVGVEIKIKFSNGYYAYQLPSYYSDVSEFKHIIENAILPFDSVDDKSAADFERAILLYQNDYLAENGYLWSLTESRTLHKQFESTALALSRYYFLTHNYGSTKRVLMKLLDNDNLNETVHELLLKVYFQENDYSSFISHYVNLAKLLFSELGTLPRNSIRNLYKNIFLHAQKNTSIETAYF